MHKEIRKSRLERGELLEFSMVKESRQQATAIRFSEEEGGVEIGRAWLYIIHNDLHPEPYGFLEDVFVRESARKSGIATRLVNAVKERCKKEHCYKLVATSRHGRDKVHKLYLDLGFRPHGHEFRIDFTEGETHDD